MSLFLSYLGPFLSLGSLSWSGFPSSFRTAASDLFENKSKRVTLPA